MCSSDEECNADNSVYCVQDYSNCFYCDTASGACLPGGTIDSRMEWAIFKELFSSGCAGSQNCPFGLDCSSDHLCVSTSTQNN